MLLLRYSCSLEWDTYINHADSTKHANSSNNKVLETLVRESGTFYRYSLNTPSCSVRFLKTVLFFNRSKFNSNSRLKITSYTKGRIFHQTVLRKQSVTSIYEYSRKIKRLIITINHNLIMQKSQNQPFLIKGPKCLRRVASQIT